MRRLILVALLLLVPALAVGPGLVQANTAISSAVHTPAPERKHTPTAKPAKHKKHTKKTKKTKCPKGKVRKGKKCVKKSTKVHTAIPTPTSTPTVTPTVTATPTMTPTPPPATASIHIQANTLAATNVGFYVCGLPDGVTASFDPNPGTSAPNPTASTHYAAGTTLTLTSAWTTTPNTYGLQIFGYYKAANGSTSPRGGSIEPSGVLLTVDGSGNAIAKGSDQVVSGDYGNCSAPPSGFGPAPTPTLGPNDVVLSSSVSDANPQPNERITITGRIMIRGYPGDQIDATFRFFGLRSIPPCYTMTDSTGTARCTITNSNPISGSQETVQITFTYAGKQYVTYTSYTM